MKSAIRDEDPVIYLEHKFLYRRIKEDLPEGDYTVPIGRACVRRRGEDMTVLTYGAMVYVALQAADELDREGIDLEIVDLRSLLPLDRGMILESVKKNGKVFILHGDTRTGGSAGEITAIICEEVFDHLDGPVLRVTAPDTPVPFSPPLEESFIPKAAEVIKVARRLAAY